MPWEAFARGSKNMTDQPGCLRVNVAVCANEPNRNRADAPKDASCTQVTALEFLSHNHGKFGWCTLA